MSFTNGQNQRKQSSQLELISTMRPPQQPPTDMHHLMIMKTNLRKPKMQSSQNCLQQTQVFQRMAIITKRSITLHHWIL